MISDWWAEPVKAIWNRAYAELGENDKALSVLDYGPAHVVWADDNFGDDSVRFCIKCCRDDEWRMEWVNRFGEDGLSEKLAIVRRSLEELLAIPEDERGDDPFDEDEQ